MRWRQNVLSDICPQHFLGFGHSCHWQAGHEHDLMLRDKQQMINMNNTKINDTD